MMRAVRRSFAARCDCFYSLTKYSLLSLQAVGNPVPAKFWSKEGQQQLMFPGHASDDGRITVNNDGTLSISNIRPNDQGYYVCSALNAAGSNIARAHLKIASKSLLPQPPPLISQVMSLLIACSPICNHIGSRQPNTLH